MKLVIDRYVAGCAGVILSTLAGLGFPSHASAEVPMRTQSASVQFSVYQGQTQALAVPRPRLKTGEELKEVVLALDANGQFGGAVLNISSYPQTGCYQSKNALSLKATLHTDGVVLSSRAQTGFAAMETPGTIGPWGTVLFEKAVGIGPRTFRFQDREQLLALSRGALRANEALALNISIDALLGGNQLIANGGSSPCLGVSTGADLAGAATVTYIIGIAAAQPTVNEPALQPSPQSELSTKRKHSKKQRRKKARRKHLAHRRS